MGLVVVVFGAAVILSFSMSHYFSSCIGLSELRYRSHIPETYYQLQTDNRSSICVMAL